MAGRDAGAIREMLMEEFRAELQEAERRLDIAADEYMAFHSDPRERVSVWCYRCGEPVENIQTHCLKVHKSLPVGRVIG